MATVVWYVVLAPHLGFCDDFCLIPFCVLPSSGTFSLPAYRNWASTPPQIPVRIFTFSPPPLLANPRIGRLGIAYGRYLIPPWAPEQALDDDPNVITTRRRIFFPLNAPADSVYVEYSEDVELTPEELSPERQRTGRWVYYKTWEMKPEALEGKEAGGKGVDMVMVHGAWCRSQAQL
jgi:hypothetical protein